MSLILCGRSIALALVLASLVPWYLSAQVPRMIDAGGHRLEMILKGEAKPTVVFDAGMCGGMHGWDAVQDSVSQQTSTVIYERAGFGESEEGPYPRSARQIATELHAALENVGVRFPIVLVGHSAGGLFAVVFTALFPDDVAGLVLVDASTGPSYQHLRDTDPQRWQNRSDPSTWADGWSAPAAWKGQMEALPESVDQYETSWPLPRIPTVVLSAGASIGGARQGSGPGTSSWVGFQEALAARIPGARQVVLPDANHGTILRSAALHREILSVVNQVSGR